MEAKVTAKVVSKVEKPASAREANREKHENSTNRRERPDVTANLKNKGRIVRFGCMFGVIHIRILIKYV
jgi:hypothetical protein